MNKTRFHLHMFWRILNQLNLLYICICLNSTFTVVFYTTRWTKQDPTCICLKEFLNQLNLLYICIWFTIDQELCACELMGPIVDCDHYLDLKDFFKINLISFIFAYAYIYSRSRVMGMQANAAFWASTSLWAKRIYLRNLLRTILYACKLSTSAA
jgi:hypothetical protein